MLYLCSWCSRIESLNEWCSLWGVLCSGFLFSVEQCFNIMLKLGSKSLSIIYSYLFYSWESPVPNFTKFSIGLLHNVLPSTRDLICALTFRVSWLKWVTFGIRLLHLSCVNHEFRKQFIHIVFVSVYTLLLTTVKINTNSIWYSHAITHPSTDQVQRCLT